jgi:hypothetical protein
MLLVAYSPSAVALVNGPQLPAEPQTDLETSASRLAGLG